MTNQKRAEERIPPRFGKKSEKRKPTKRHLEDKLKALHRDFDKWDKDLTHHSGLFKRWAREIRDRIWKQIVKIEKQIKEPDAKD